MPKFSFKEVAPCLFAIFIDLFGIGVVVPMIMIIFNSPGHNIFLSNSVFLNYLYFGIAYTIYPLCMFFATSFFGDLSDIIGRKRTLLISTSGQALAFLITGLGVIFSNIFLFLLGRALSGIGAASQSVAMATISDLSNEANKALHLSYVTIVNCIGIIAGPLVGGLLAGINLSVPCFVSGALAFFAFLWILISFKETFVKSHKKFSVFRIVTIFIEAYKNKRLRQLSTAFLLMEFGILLFIPIVLIILSSKFNYSSIKLGLFSTYLGIGFLIGSAFFLPKMLKIFKIEHVVYIAFVGLFISNSLLALLIYHEIPLYLFSFILAVNSSVVITGMFTAFSDIADNESQGWVMGVAVALQALSNALTGFFADFVTLFGGESILFLGSLSIAASLLIMRNYFSKYPI